MLSTKGVVFGVSSFCPCCKRRVHEKLPSPDIPRFPEWGVANTEAWEVGHRQTFRELTFRRFRVETLTPAAREQEKANGGEDCIAPGAWYTQREEVLSEDVLLRSAQTVLAASADAADMLLSSSFGRAWSMGKL